MKRGIFLLIMTTISVVHTVNAQDVALKTNILSDAFMNINAGIEVGLAPRWTLDVSGGLNAWTLSHSRRWKASGGDPHAVHRHGSADSAQSQALPSLLQSP